MLHESGTAYKGMEGLTARCTVTSIWFWGALKQGPRGGGAEGGKACAVARARRRLVRRPGARAGGPGLSPKRAEQRSGKSAPGRRRGLRAAARGRGFRGLAVLCQREGAPRLRA